MLCLRKRSKRALHLFMARNILARNRGGKARNRHGSMLALIGAIGAGILIMILLFAIGYVRILGTNPEQRTAIEAAALAAAKDISRIVINDPNLGFVGFSDAAPVGKGTKAPAPDNFYMPVHGINTMMGTLRLDFIIADRLNSETLRGLVRRDLNHLKAAKDRLAAATSDALNGSGAARDLDGNPVDPYASAVNAYKQNTVRMAGPSSYVNGTMKLTLGSVVNGSQTNIPIPSPASYAQVPAGGERNGYYMSGVDIPYGGEHFVFAAINNTIKLVNPNDFRATLANVPFSMPSVVRAEADQRITDQNNHTSHVVHIIACAQAASVHDPRPAPGALSVSFPDGIMPELNKPGDLINLPTFNSGAPMVLQTPDSGDFPTTPSVSMIPTTWDGPGAANVSSVWTHTLYDWLRRAGSRLNAKAAVDMQNTPFTYTGPGSNGCIYTNLYKVDTNGDIIHETNLVANGNTTPTRVDPYPVASHQQLFATGADAMASSDKFGYDAYIRDFCYRPGLMRGGIHGGEPLTKSLANVAPTSSSIISGDIKPISIAWDGTRGSGGACDSGGIGDGAHWKIDLGTGGSPVAGLHVFTVDGHETTFFVFPDAPLSRNDWGLHTPGVPVYYRFTNGPAAGAARPTYLQNGLTGDIRFRKTIPLAKSGLTGKAHGTTGLRIYPPPSVSPLYKPGW